MKKFIGSLVLLGLLLVVGCKKSSSPTSPTNSTAPTAPAAVQLNALANTPIDSTNAQITKSYVTIASSLIQSASAYFAFAAAGGQQSGNTWTWVYNVPSTTLVYTITATLNGNFWDWSIKFDGSDGITSYSNWIAYTFHVSTDGKTGNVVFYDLNSATLKELDYDWTSDVSNNVTFHLNSYWSGTSNKDGYWVIVSNADLSGSVNYYTYASNGTTVTSEWHATWTNSGQHGTWNNMPTGSSSGIW